MLQGQGAASCDLGAESGPISQGSGFQWGPSNQSSIHPAFIILLDCLLSQAMCWSQGLPADEPAPALQEPSGPGGGRWGEM